MPGRCGVCLIAGTGSIALGRDQTGRQARTGGWGHIVGDEGSGFDIGRRALQAVLRAADGRGPQTTLQEALLRAWGLASPPELMGRVYPASGQVVVPDIADLAGLVFAQAAAGDPVARRIVDRAAGELTTAVLAVIADLSFPGAVPLAVTGGVLRHQPRLRAAILRRVRRRQAVGPVVVVEVPRWPPRWRWP